MKHESYFFIEESKQKAICGVDLVIQKFFHCAFFQKVQRKKELKDLLHFFFNIHI